MKRDGKKMLRRVKTLRFLRNEVVLITGGSSGIGKELAFEAARRGAIVVVVSRNLEKLQEVAKKCLILSGRPAFAFFLPLLRIILLNKFKNKFFNSYKIAILYTFSS